MDLGEVVEVAQPPAGQEPAVNQGPADQGPAADDGGAYRTKNVMIRVTEQERDRLHAAARAAGFGKTATWARGVLLGHLVARTKATTARSEFEPFRRELTRIGANLNQVARALNVAAKAGDPVGREAGRELDRLSAEVRALRAALEAATSTGSAS